MPHDRKKLDAPAKDSYTPNGNAPYWPTKEAPKTAVPAELGGAKPEGKPEATAAAEPEAKTEAKAAAEPAKAQATQESKPAEAAKPGLPTELTGTGAASLVQRRTRDISDKSIDPWVYDFAYDNVNPENLPRTGAAPKSDVYWKDIYANNKYGHKPVELEGASGQKFQTPPAELVQREQIMNNPYHSYL